MYNEVTDKRGGGIIMQNKCKDCPDWYGCQILQHRFGTTHCGYDKEIVDIIYAIELWERIDTLIEIKEVEENAKRIQEK